VRAVQVRPEVDLSNDRSAERYGRALVQTLPRDAIILHFGTPREWQYRIVFEYYFQVTLGQRLDVESLQVDARELSTAADNHADTHGMPPTFARVFATGRPVYMYEALTQVEPFVNITWEGELFRVTPKRGRPSNFAVRTP